MNINKQNGDEFSSDEHYMRLALAQAQAAADEGEVPTGCIIVHCPPDSNTRRIIGRAHNQTECLHDATAHAEMIAITQAAAALNDWRLTNTCLYVTKEPCSMCCGAIILARIPKVCWGVSDPQRGGHSVFGILNHPGLNHRAKISTGILEPDAKHILQNFFRERRQTKKDPGRS